MMDAGVEGMMISPGYSYDKAPDQQHFTGREGNQSMFRKILSNRDPRWQFNMSPLFLEFLMGKRNLQCTPWGMPAYSIFGWQKPCYLLQDGYTDTFQELLDSTDWSKYGYESGNPKCANCMLHSGYEASAVDYTFSFKRRLRHRSRHAVLAISRCARRSDRSKPRSRSRTLVQIEAIAPRPTLKGTDIAGPEQLADGIEQAFDYRGDVTVTLNSGESLEGYIFDREPGRTAPLPRMRIMTKAGQKVTVNYADVAQRLLHRSRYGGRTQLGSLGAEVRRAQGRRREEHRASARCDRLARAVHHFARVMHRPPATGMSIQICRI